MELRKVTITPAKCAVDLGDGSERGPYVNQDYIFTKMDRPHRGINLMYCYYPLDETFPQRASECHTGGEVTFQWDYAYDDYFTYKGGLEGNTDGEPFTYMREVRKHGQDVVLTLTCDPHVSDEQIKAIAKDLRTYGRIFLRLNHEATGNWFSFNKRASYEEVGAFFAHFSDIIHEEAPNVLMILCIDGIPTLDDEKIDKEEAFAEAIRKADIWSVDKYIALNWGWPFEIAEKDNFQHKLDPNEQLYELTKKTYNRFSKICGGAKKPMLISEFNADGDVTGPYLQCDRIKNFTDMIKSDSDNWFSGFTMYQFRDNGRLGLEYTDPNNEDNGIPCPLFDTYKEIINDDFFKPGLDVNESVTLPLTLRWGNSEDSDGLSIELDIENNPLFAEAYFENSLLDMNLVLELNGKWFYKAPGVKFVDFMPAFYGENINEPCKMNLNIFAPPATGENDPSQGTDWDTNYYTQITELPNIRLRFDPIWKK